MFAMKTIPKLQKQKKPENKIRAKTSEQMNATALSKVDVMFDHADSTSQFEGVVKGKNVSTSNHLEYGEETVKIPQIKGDETAKIDIIMGDTSIIDD